MKKIFNTIVFLAVVVVVLMGYSNLKARWDAEERQAAIDRVIQERIASANADAARRNKIADRLQQEAFER